MMARSFVAAALAVVLSCGLAFAQSNEVPGGVGVGAGVARDHRGSTDYGPDPLSYSTPAYSTRDWRKSFADPRLATPVLRLRSDLAPSVTFQAGTLSNERQEGNHRDMNRAGAMDRGDGEPGFGGFAGLLVNDDETAGTAVGINLQGVADGSASGDGMLFELGADYTTAVAESWRFSARLSSSFAAENAMGPILGAGGNGSARSGLDKSDTDGGFKDVGLGLGLDYSFAESWNLETNLGYTRSIGDANRRSLADDDASSQQFFGGVVVNYRF